jgi:hypothetical protein
MARFRIVNEWFNGDLDLAGAEILRDIGDDHIPLVHVFRNDELDALVGEILESIADAHFDFDEHDCAAVRAILTR